MSSKLWKKTVTFLTAFMLSLSFLPQGVYAQEEQEPVENTEIDSLEVPTVTIKRIAIVPFVEKLNAKQTTAVSVEMRKLTATAASSLPMTVSEMSVFMGSTPI